MSLCEKLRSCFWRYTGTFQGIVWITWIFRGHFPESRPGWLSVSCFSCFCDGLETGWVLSSPQLGSFTCFCLFDVILSLPRHEIWIIRLDPLKCVSRGLHFLFTPKRAASSQTLLCSCQRGATASGNRVKIKPREIHDDKLEAEKQKHQSFNALLLQTMLMLC